MPVYDISPGVKGLIFDLDGTLADTMPWHFRAWQKACSRFGITMETEFLQAHTGAPGWEIAGEVIEINGKRGMISPEEILKMKMEEFYKIQHNVTPIEPVIALVKNREAVERTLEIVGIRHYFDIIVTAHDVTRHKPHPETFLRCAELMGVAPEECEVFEDGDLGLRAARSAGMIATDVSKWYDSTWPEDLKV